MKRIVVAFLFVASSVAQEKRSDIVLHKFATWESLRTPQEKLVYEQGFMNGYFAGPRSERFVDLLNCLETRTTPDQTIAIIDKYYADRPWRALQPAAFGIIEALTRNEDSPCYGEDPSTPR